jgi:hypothetical protein
MKIKALSKAKLSKLLQEIENLHRTSFNRISMKREVPKACRMTLSGFYKSKTIAKNNQKKQ